MIHPQAQWAIEKLLAAGWKRSEFQVRTATRHWQQDGIRMTEFGDAQIYLRSDRKHQFEMVAPMVKAGLNVTMVYGRTGWLTVLVNDKYNRAPLGITDLTHNDYLKRWQAVPVVLPNGKGD